MAGFVYGGGDGYRGLPEIFEFVNDDGELFWRNCGQAAAATLLLHAKRIQASQADACFVMRRIEDAYPPDNLFGWLGTSRRRVTQICKAHGVTLTPVDGEEAFRQALDRGCPVVVMLGTYGGKFLGFDLPSGHWMVAYGYDAESVYLTNCGAMSWDEFRRGWGSFVPRLIWMRQRGLVADGELKNENCKLKIAN